MEKNTVKLLANDYRKEIKFLLPIAQIAFIKNQLSQLHFKEQYFERKVNSIYFDTIDEDFLYDSQEGIANRMKVRLRYYNQDEGLQLEKKIKRDLLGEKDILKIEEAAPDLNNFVAWEQKASKWCDMPLKATAKIAYHRNYFHNSQRGIRITLDHQLTTKELRFGRTRLLKDFFVIEIKCREEVDLDLGINIFRQRFSKYSFARFAD
jgi:hypothetical protein